MKKILNILIAFIFILSCSCQSKNPLIDLSTAELVSSQTSIALELSWGMEQYMVGYDSDWIVENAEQGTTVGPADYAVDDEENIYIADYINSRFLKYDKEGGFIGEISLDRFGSEYGYMLADYNCLYFIGTEKCILNRYSFEDDSMQSLSLVNQITNNGHEVSEILSDGNGNIYLITAKRINAETHSYLFKVDSLLSMVIEERALPLELGGRHCVVDSEGNLYYLAGEGNGSNNMSIFQIGVENSVEKMVTMICESKDDLPHLRLIGVLGGSDYFLEYIYQGYMVTRVNDNGSSSKTVLKKQSKFPIDKVVISKETDVYFNVIRNFLGDDRSPFQVFRASVDW